MANNLDRFNKRRAQSGAAWAGGMVQVDAGEMNRLAIDLANAASSVAAEVSQVVRASALRVEAEAKAFSPVDTGFLRSSIGTDVDADRLGASVGPSAAYGAFVELGTDRAAPRAYLGPAFDRAQPDFVAGLMKATEGLL